MLGALSNICWKNMIFVLLETCWHQVIRRVFGPLKLLGQEATTRTVKSLI